VTHINFGYNFDQSLNSLSSTVRSIVVPIDYKRDICRRIRRKVQRSWTF